MARKTTSKKKHTTVPRTATKSQTPVIEAAKPKVAKATQETSATIVEVTIPAVDHAPETEATATEATATEATATEATAVMTPIEDVVSETTPTVPTAQAVTSETIEPQLADLQSYSAWTRETAAIELGRLGNRAAVSALLGSLNDESADVAREAATSLGRLGDTSALEALIDVIDNSNGYFHSVVRAAAASSLGELKDARALDSLLRAIHDPIAEVSAEAIRGLAALGDERAVDSLIDIVRDQSGFFVPSVRRAAVLALARIGGDEALAELRSVASNCWEDSVIRDEAAQATAAAE